MQAEGHEITELKNKFQDFLDREVCWSPRPWHCCGPFSRGQTQKLTSLTPTQLTPLTHPTAGLGWQVH